MPILLSIPFFFIEPSGFFISFHLLGTIYSTHLIKVACEVVVGNRTKLIINGNDYETKDGTPVRDFIHVSDLVDIHIICADDLINKNNSNIFNCGYGVGYSVLDVVNKFSKITGKNLPIQ